MREVNCKDKAVLVTGGTSGIGLAAGLAFGRLGAKVYLTHRWGSADENDLKAKFKMADCLEPVIVEADVSVKEDTCRLMQAIKNSHDSIEVLISNVAFAHVSKHYSDLKRKELLRSLKYSAWPFVEYLQVSKEVFGKYPRYAVGLSSPGPDSYLPGYDFIAASKAVMESFCRSLTAVLIDEDIRINILRANPVISKSLEATFGPEFVPFFTGEMGAYGRDFFIKPEEVAGAITALCGGGMDAVKGQVLLLDRGLCFADNLCRMFEIMKLRKSNHLDKDA